MGTIFSAQIYLDDDMPEYMDGLIRIGSVDFFDEDGETIQDVALNNRLVDNAEFHDPRELIESVAKRLGIKPDRVEIVE